MNVYALLDQDQVKNLKPSDLKELEFVSLNTLNQLKDRIFPVSKNPAILQLDSSRMEGFIEQDAGYRSWRFKNDTTMKDLKILEEIPESEKTCILMNTSMIDEAWCKKAIRPFLKPSDRVCVVAMSYFNDTKNLDDFNRQYGKGQGIWYRANTDVFNAFGIKSDQVIWINPFKDSDLQMKAKVMDSTVLMLPGGAPDLFMKRLKKHRLAKTIRNFSGLLIGYSAGAMVMLQDYHITPDEDYSEFSWNRGLGILTGFDIEAHYHATPHQKRHIQRAREEKGLPVYAIYEQGGMITDGTEHQFFGQVDFFTDELSE